MFASPYFKDVNFFSHPDNPDTIKKKRGDELDVYLQNPREWTRTDKQKLKRAVVQLAKDDRMTPILKSEKFQLQKLQDRFTTAEQKEDIMTKLRKLKEDEDEVKNLSEIQ